MGDFLRNKIPSHCGETNPAQLRVISFDHNEHLCSVPPTPTVPPKPPARGDGAVLRSARLHRLYRRTAFTVASEPEEVMGVLREYHKNLGELIFQYEGTLERFLGDGIMIVFNDPIPCDDHTERAVRLALDMRARVAKLAEQWAHKGHVLGFGIGIVSGYATLGQVGFKHRREYTAIGRAINLASRLVTKQTRPDRD
jgi:hypothetical protein